MVGGPGLAMDEVVKAHAAAADADIARLGRRRPRARRSDRVGVRGGFRPGAEPASAGLPAAQPAPWPPSTWEFLRKHAARVRT